MWVFTEFGDQQASKIRVRTKYFLIRCTWVTNLRGPGAPALTKMLKDRKILQSKRVKHTPKILLMNWLFEKWIVYSRSCNWCQIQSGISAYVMSGEYVMRTSLYLDRLKIFEWMKFLRRHLRQIWGNWVGWNFPTALRVNSRLITHARMQKWIWNLQVPMDSTFE